MRKGRIRSRRTRGRALRQPSSAGSVAQIAIDVRSGRNCRLGGVENALTPQPPGEDRDKNVCRPDRVLKRAVCLCGLLIEIGSYGRFTKASSSARALAYSVKLVTPVSTACWK
jgi:hypothetical protein